MTWPPTEIWILFAVSHEARPFLRRIGRARPGIRVVVTGMGHANAAASIVRELSARPPSLVLTCGFAGGLDPGLPAGHVAFDLDPDVPLAPCLERLGASRAAFAHVDRVLLDAAEKFAFRKRSGADVADMESSVIRERCRAAGVPSGTIRVVSDAAGEALPLDFNALMTDELRMDYWRLAGSLVRRPSAIPALVRFQGRVAAAARRLAETLAAVVESCH